MKLRNKLALAVLAAVISLPAAFAQGPGPDPGNGPGGDPTGPPPMHHPRGNDDGGWKHHEGGEWGRDGRMGHRHHGEFMLMHTIENPMIRQRLGITDDQVAKIKQQSSAFRKTEIRNHAEMEIKRVELHDLLSADQPDRAAIDRKLEEISTTRLAQEKAAVGFHLSIRDVFTPEQRAKMKEMREGHWQHDGMGPHPGHGPSQNRGNYPNQNRPPDQQAPPPPQSQN